MIGVEDLPAAGQHAVAVRSIGRAAGPARARQGLMMTVRNVVEDRQSDRCGRTLDAARIAREPDQHVTACQVFATMPPRFWRNPFPSYRHPNQKEDHAVRNLILITAAAVGLFAAGAAGASAAPAASMAAPAVRGAATNIYYGQEYYGGGYYRNEYPRYWHRHYPRYAYGPYHHWHHRHWDEGRWYYR